MHILAENLHLMAKHIVDCVNGEKEEEIGTTKIGLTKFSHLVSKNHFCSQFISLSFYIC